LDKQHNIIEKLPLFPLGIVVLPGETRFLHIFEQRYRNLFDDIGDSDCRFGIPFVSKGRMEGIGSLVKFEKTLAKYPNGEVDIAIKGIDLLNVKDYFTQHPERSYPYGNIETLDKNTITASSSLLTTFEKYNHEVLKLDLAKFPKMNFYVIANSVGLSDLEKYDLLIREGDEAINRTLINHIRMRTILASQQNSLKEYYCLN
jgi:hypothetical protein